MFFYVINHCAFTNQLIAYATILDEQGTKIASAAIPISFVNLGIYNGELLFENIFPMELHVNFIFGMKL